MNSRGQIIEFNVFGDDRGSLVAFENQSNVPFDIKRVYYIYGTEQGYKELHEKSLASS